MPKPYRACAYRNRGARNTIDPPVQMLMLQDYGGSMREVAARLAHMMIAAGKEPESFAAALVEVVTA